MSMENILAYIFDSHVARIWLFLYVCVYDHKKQVFCINKVDPLLIKLFTVGLN